MPETFGHETSYHKEGDVLVLRRRHGSTFLVHKMDGTHHQLRAGDTESQWEDYSEVARAGSYAATTEYWQGIFPAIFRVETVQPHPQPASARKR